MVGKAAGTIAVAILLTVASITPGGAITVETIQGHIKDPSGRPLIHVAVTDRTNVAYSDASGFYKINESNVATYQVTASRSGLNGQTRTVAPTDALNSVDFTLTYVVTGALARSSLSTATSASTTTLTITSFAPVAGTCVAVTDTRNHSTNPATYLNSNGDGSSTYSYVLNVPQGTAETSYALEFSANTCGSGSTQLSNSQSVSYLIDNTAPGVSSLLPSLNSNVRYSSQPLTAQLRDGGSGIDQSATTFALHDMTSGAVATYGLSKLQNGVAQSASASLAIGHRYTFAVSAADLAGNRATVDEGATAGNPWLAMAISSTGAANTLEPNNGSVDTNPAHVNSDGTFTATFNNVVLDTGGATVTLSDSNHAGVGFLSYSVPLLSVAEVCTTTGTLQSCGPVSAGSDTRWTSRDVRQRFDVPTAAPQTDSAAPLTTSVGQLTAHVRGTNAVLKTATPLSLNGDFGTCDSPLNGPTDCTPDPIPVAKISPTTPNITGSVISNAPFAYRGSADGYTITFEFTSNDPSQPTADMTIVDPAGAVTRINAVGTTNSDGSVSVVASSPQTSQTYSQTFAKPNLAIDGAPASVCKWCFGVTVAAYTAAALGCLFASAGCAEYVAVAGAGSALYCAAHTCAPPQASCTLESSVNDNSHGQYTPYDTNPGFYQVFVQNAVQCSDYMKNLEIWYDFFQDGNPVFFSDTRPCDGQRSCIYDDLWHFDSFYGHCYRAHAYFQGVWHDPATNQDHSYSGDTLSNRFCPQPF